MRILWVATLIAAPCALAKPMNVFPTDIFNNDSTMRVPAPKNDLRWTVSLGGCSGSMLSPKYLLTAYHCNPNVGDSYTSGACLELGCSRDLKVVRIVERYPTGSSYDATIVEVTWNRADSRWRQRYTPRIQMEADELTFGRDGEASALFTVGFPADKPGAMLARGYAKGSDGKYLLYNVGSINGNSGGAVWKEDDYTLVSMTNSGPHNFGQPGWNNNNPENPNAWNNGAHMHLVYKA